ncbi:hypothetical protein JCM5353_002093 [Sporobolomyces roseus]
MDKGTLQNGGDHYELERRRSTLIIDRTPTTTLRFLVTHSGSHHAEDDDERNGIEKREREEVEIDKSQQLRTNPLHYFALLETCQLWGGKLESWDMMENVKSRRNGNGNGETTSLSISRFKHLTIFVLQISNEFDRTQRQTAQTVDSVISINRGVVYELERMIQLVTRTFENGNHQNQSFTKVTSFRNSHKSYSSHLNQSTRIRITKSSLSNSALFIEGMDLKLDGDVLCTWNPSKSQREKIWRIRFTLNDYQRTRHSRLSINRKVDQQPHLHPIIPLHLSKLSSTALLPRGPGDQIEWV